MPIIHVATETNILPSLYLYRIYTIHLVIYLSNGYTTFKSIKRAKINIFGRLFQGPTLSTKNYIKSSYEIHGMR